MGATAGDLMVRDLACDWLDDAGYAYDVAVDFPFIHDRGVDWRAAAPDDYTGIIFVCGPLGDGPPATEFFAHFRNCAKIGLDLSMLQKLGELNPFALLIERDSDRAAHPDLALASRTPKVPVVGVILAHPQKEYKQAGQHAAANAAFHRLTRARKCAVLYIDTCLDPWNQYGLRTAAEIESLIAKMDVVLTTRLHGLVLSLKNHVPAIVIDPVKGGAKLTRQARVLGWSHIFAVDAMLDEALAHAFDCCLGEQASAAARSCAENGLAAIHKIRTRFMAELPKALRQRDPSWPGSS